jgi:hypothetical protein
MSLDYLALVQVSQFIVNYLNNYSKVHPTLLLPDLFTTFVTLNYVELDDDSTYTTNMSLSTFQHFADLGPNF